MFFLVLLQYDMMFINSCRCLGFIVKKGGPVCRENAGLAKKVISECSRNGDLGQNGNQKELKKLVVVVH